MILFAALALRPVDPIALGRARADFGEIPNSGKWKFVFTGQFRPTVILFPAGRSDVRYYLVGIDGPGYRLCRQSKYNGEISQDWMFETTIPNKTFVRNSRDGVLREYIMDFLLPKGLSDDILKDLNSNSSFASYVPQGGGPKIGYHRRGEILFLLSENDTNMKVRTWEIPPNEMRLLPRTTEPYPITNQELADIKNGFVRIKN